MRKKIGWMVALGGAAAGLVLSTGIANAAAIWTADPAKGVANFGIGNCAAPGRISAASDPVKGAVIRFTKPAGDKRCEGHGIKVGGQKYSFQNNSTYYLGWSMKLTSNVNNNANFQWKSYGHHIQNFPLVLKMIGGKLTLMNHQPGNKTFYPWAKPLAANTWITLALGIHTSDALTGGWVELYVNGVQQTLSNGQKRWPCRTWDDTNDPKWGVYGATGQAVTNDVAGLKVGTSYADVR
jgi:Polysaccharide lyase